MSAPYRAPLPVPPPPRDTLGYALVGVPLSAAILQSLLPWTLAGTAIGLAGIVASIVLIRIDAKRWGQDPSRHVQLAIFLWVVCFPIYMRRRALWGPPNRLAYAIVAVVLFVVGSFYRPFAPADRAFVSCFPVGKTLAEGLDCTLVHKRGSGPVHACWDVSVTCANGPGGSAHACGTVSPGAPSHVAVPASHFEGAYGCAPVTIVEAHHLVVDY